MDFIRAAAARYYMRALWPGCNVLPSNGRLLRREDAEDVVLRPRHKAFAPICKMQHQQRSSMQAHLLVRQRMRPHLAKQVSAHSPAAHTGDPQKLQRVDTGFSQRLHGWYSTAAVAGDLTRERGVLAADRSTNLSARSASPSDGTNPQLAGDKRFTPVGEM